MSSAPLPPINAATRLVAVYGQPIRHSASPAMQNAGIAHLGLDWRYLACEVDPAELPAALAGAQAMRFVGLNLTVPHKLLAVALVDSLDASAQAWGAVNTVVFEGQLADGSWRALGQLPTHAGPVRSRGYNTDADAIVRSLREDLGINPRGTRILLLGAGGAGRAAALRLAAEGVAGLWLVNRTAAKAAEVASEIRARFPTVPVHLGYPDHPVDLVLNATSLGLKAGDPLPFDPAHLDLQRTPAVYDMIYRPAVTPLLGAARSAGCRTANGLGMLLYQGAAALELWSGRSTPVAVMRAALELEIYR